MFVAIGGQSMPTFWLGLNLIFVFGVLLRWLPVAGYQPLSEGLWESLRYMIIPAVTLGLAQGALLARMTRSMLLETLSEDYVRTARAKGLGERRVVTAHALRNAMIPLVTVIGLTFAILMGGAVITEQIFNIPGVGRLLIQGVARRDYPLVQGIVLVIARYLRPDQPAGRPALRLPRPADPGHSRLSRGGQRRRAAQPIAAEGDALAGVLPSP